MAEALAFFEDANASMLAKTPAIIPWKTWTSNQDWEDFRSYLEVQLWGLRQWRTPWWMHAGEIANEMLPRRYFWVITPNNMTRGLPINQNVVDSTATQAIGVCASGMMDGLSSPTKIWFKLDAPEGFEIDEGGKLWLNEFQRRIYEVLAGSNYYDRKYQFYEDQITFGTAPMLIYEDRDRVIDCQVPCFGEYFGACANNNSIETFYREFVLTVRAIVQRFGPKAVAGTDVGELWNSKQLNTEFIVAHCIEPNFPAEQYGQKPKLGVIPGGFAYREVYWLRGMSSPQPLAIKGYREKPFMYAPWTQRANDPYGRGLGQDALPDVRQLNRLTERVAEAIDKGIRPSMLADASLKNEPASTLPNKVTYVPNLTTSGGMKAMYEPDPRFIEFGDKIIERLQTRVEKWFHNDTFLMISQMEGVQPRNELELTERRGEKLLRLGPVIERNLREDQIGLQRVVSIMNRRGLVPPRPMSMRNVPIQVKFVSKLALIQQAAKTAGMERTMVMAGRMEAAMPGTLDNINSDKFIRDYGEAVEYPPEDWNDPQTIKTIRGQRQEAAQAANQAHMAEKVTPAMASAAQNLSQTDTGGGLNALQLLLGNTGGPQPPGVGK
jgi:Bacteriophage head to tail connecting protein